MNSVVRIAQDATERVPAATAMAAGALPLDLIDIPADRSRGVDAEWVAVLARMIGEAGQINPVTVRRLGDRYQLVTGLHRLSAVTALGADTIAARISGAATDDEAKREEILENIGHNDLNALDRAHHLHDLKQVYERLYPETRAGVAGALAKHGGASEQNSFAWSASEETGLGVRSVEIFVAIWRDLSVESRRRCAGTWIAAHRSSLIALSKLTHALQSNVLDLLLSENPQATTVADALQLIANGRLATHVEKKFDGLNRKLKGLKDEELEAVLTLHAERIIGALKRMGRI